MVMGDEEDVGETRGKSSAAIPSFVRDRGIGERIRSSVTRNPDRELTLAEIVEDADLVIPFLGVTQAGKTNAICAFLHWALSGNEPRAEITYQPSVKGYKNYAEEKLNAWLNRKDIPSTGPGEIHPIKLLFRPRKFVETIDREICVVVYDISGKDYAQAAMEKNAQSGPTSNFSKFMVGVTNPVVLFDVVKEDTFVLPKKEDWPSIDIKSRIGDDGLALHLALEQLGDYKTMCFALMYAKSDKITIDNDYVTTASLAKLLEGPANIVTSQLYGRYKVFKLSAELYRQTNELPLENPEFGVSFEAICRYFARQLHNVRK